VTCSITFFLPPAQQCQREAARGRSIPHSKKLARHELGTLYQLHLADEPGFDRVSACKLRAWIRHARLQRGVLALYRGRPTERAPTSNTRHVIPPGGGARYSWPGVLRAYFFHFILSTYNISRPQLEISQRRVKYSCVHDVPVVPRSRKANSKGLFGN
jgi:hypothetical protein